MADSQTPCLVANGPFSSSQQAIVTKEMGLELNLSLSCIEIPEPTGNESLVKIICTGICRSDICFSIGPEDGYPTHNHIAGHEGIGRVVKSSDSTLVGKLVATRFLASSCGCCTYCLRNLETSCVNQYNIPKHRNGTLQQFMAVPTSYLMELHGLPEIDKDLSKYCAALCSGSAALRAIRNANTSPGDVVVVVGILGGIGHLVGMLAKQVFALKVIGVDLKSKIDVFPAKHTVMACDVLLPAVEDQDPTALVKLQDKIAVSCARLRNDTGTPRAADAVVVTSSRMSGFQRLENFVCDGGSIVCVGVPRESNTLSIPLPSLVERSLRIVGSLMGGRRDALEMIHYIKSGQIDPIITKIELDQVPLYMAKIRDAEIIGKVVVQMPVRG
ncbi:unnamed protein product [Clonostachys byssicola]|uniref:Alcohol dehydrogenase-like N-terminal domain-containing protein n=1 Tax=Clonostachys byssicola TaxID=160290 RepID=A0A9N9UMN5_9HYPO|nr:unnamed protein product [Clonostachys byssicola]